MGVPGKQLLQQRQKMIVENEALRQWETSCFLGHLVVHFAPSYLPGQCLVLVVRRDVIQAPGETGQQDVQIGSHERDTPDVHLGAVGKATHQPARDSYLLCQGYEMAVERVWEHCSQLVEAAGDNIGAVGFAAAADEEMRLDGNIDRGDRLHGCASSRDEGMSQQRTTKSCEDDRMAVFLVVPALAKLEHHPMTALRGRPYLMLLSRRPVAEVRWCVLACGVYLSSWCV